MVCNEASLKKNEQPVKSCSGNLKNRINGVHPAPFQRHLALKRAACLTPLT